MNILEKIISTKKTELSASRQQRGFEDIWTEAKAIDRLTLSFSEALKSSDTKIIAEFKRRSPSKGFFNAGAEVGTIVEGYSLAGAAAISVLTDTEYFGGSLEDLAKARKVAAVPLLCKDFIIDPYRICQAKIAGADVILLIAAAMQNVAQCEELAQFAHSLGLEVLLEIHNDKELKFINSHINVVGINNRDLTTFVTDTAVSLNLGKLIPDTFIKISESGISNPETVKTLQRAGFQGFLMGENFMKEANPVQALEKFINVLRQ